MFVDEITIKAKAGDGGDGVVRWRREKFIPKGGPAGGNGGRGGSVYVRAVRDLGLLSKYTGSKEFVAENGVSGSKRSMHGRDGGDLFIDIPIGATITEENNGKTYELTTDGQTVCILQGGNGGFGNENFKSSTNTTPTESTKGTKGERGTFLIELKLVVDIGFVGLPNAGKTTMLNALTNAHAKVGSYPFTTLEPHLGDLFGFILADIPGLIEGASEGKGLGHKFLRHIERTKMLLHLVSLENEDPYTTYKTIRSELGLHDEKLLEKEEWIVLTKSDLQTDTEVQSILNIFENKNIKNIYVTSNVTGKGVKKLKDDLVKHLRLENI